MPSLDWLNNQAAKRAAVKVPYRLLDVMPELCAGDANSGNMLIQGDNLEALKTFY